jgi:hypothetical protein
MNYQLQAIVNGKVQLFPVAELGMHVPVQPDAKYTLLDENGTAVVDGLVLQKKGHNLYIQVDGDSVAVIDDFYATQHDAAGYIVDGSSTPEAGMTVQGGSESTVAVSDGVVWLAPEVSVEGIAPVSEMTTILPEGGRWQYPYRIRISIHAG